MHRIYCMLLSACVLAAHPLHAQATDTTAFRRGEWGVEFVPSRNLTEGGVLRFRTPTQAWVLDGSASYDRTTTTSSSAPDQSGESVGFSARFGPRWYHSDYERVVQFLGLGITGSYARGDQVGNPTFRDENWSGGMYGEVGLQYLFTRHLGLGVRVDAVGLRNSSQITGSGIGGAERVTTYHVALESPQIIGSFYF